MYDLVFTNRRLVGIVSATLPYVTGGWSAAANREAVEEVETHPATYEVQALDEHLSRGERSFSAPYGQIEKAKVAGFAIKSLRFKFARKQYYLILPKEAIEKVRSLVAQHVPGARFEAP